MNQWIESTKAKESIAEKFKRLKFNELEIRENLIASGLFDSK